MNRWRSSGCAAIVTLFLAGVARAQGDAAADSTVRSMAERLEGMNEQLQTVAGDVDRLKKFKFSGYVQARWETAEYASDTVKVSGNPPTVTPANNNRFYIRRGRLKLTYDAAPLSQAVVYLDGASNGANINVRLLEAYVTFFDPWTPGHAHAATVGQMNVPFGYEIERSSSLRELPERSRAENVLFPGERDRGVKLVSRWTPQLETVVGVYNGGGIGDATFPTTDPSAAKDVVGRARFSQGTIDAALSGYAGEAVTPLTGEDVTTDRTRFGADTQLYYPLPPLGNGTLRGELYAGHDVNPDSTKALTTTNAGGVLLIPGADPAHFATDFIGWYAMWVQNLGEKLQFAARYEIYDPNVDADHDQFERVSLGFNWFYDGFTRVTVSYEIPKTEKLVAGRYEDPKDNLWTVQFQLKY